MHILIRFGWIYTIGSISELAVIELILLNSINITAFRTVIYHYVCVVNIVISIIRYVTFFSFYIFYTT